MEESDMKKVDGKTVFIKNGKMTDHTTYTFRDEVGDKLVLLSKNNSYRPLEGSEVNVLLKVEFNDFKRVNKVSLESVEKAK